MKPGTRIDRIHNSWRVRVPGHPQKYFSWRAHGGRDAALDAAYKWRDARWDGKSQHDRMRERNAEIVARRAAGETFRQIAADYGITAQRVCGICQAHTDTGRDAQAGEEGHRAD